LIPQRFQGVPTIVLSSLLFGSMGVLARSVAGRMPVGQLAFIRMFVGLGLLIGVFVLLKQAPEWRRRPGLLLARGAFGGLSVILWFVAIEHMQVGPATLLNNTAPAYAAVFGALFLRERASVELLVGLAVALGGAALVVFSTLVPGQTFHLGVGAAAGMASAVFSGAAMTAMRALRQDTDTFSVLFSFVFLGTLVTLPVMAAEGGPLVTALVPHALLVGTLSFVAQLLLTNAFRYVPVMIGSATTQLTTVFAWTLGVVVLGEEVRPLGVVGAVICIAGVVIASGLGARGGRALLRSRKPQA